VARADGVVKTAEAEFIEQSLVRTGLDEGSCQRIRALLDMATPHEVHTTLTRIAHEAAPAELAEFLRDAYAVATIDGEISESEVQLIEDAMAAAGIPEHGRGDVHDWAREAAQHLLHGITMIVGLKNGAVHPANIYASSTDR
jgi:uncharacterized membrane protein YebE (DUF533 family)